MGDQIFTDVCGANLAGIRTILVKPIHPKEEIQIVLKRRLEAIVLLCYRLHRKIVKPKYPSVAKRRIHPFCRINFLFAEFSMRDRTQPVVFYLTKVR